MVALAIGTARNKKKKKDATYEGPVSSLALVCRRRADLGAVELVLEASALIGVLSLLLALLAVLFTGDAGDCDVRL